MTIQNSESVFCNSCKTPLIGDIERGEYVCPGCGLVGNDRIVDTGPEWKAIDSDDKMKKVRTGAPTSLALHERGLSTQIGDIVKDGNSANNKSMERMKKWQQRLRTSSSQERGLANVLGRISEFSRLLNLPDSTKETAALIYRKALGNGTAKSKSIKGMAAASIYLACRKCGTSKSMREISDVSGLPKPTIAKYYRLILKDVEQEHVPLHPLQGYISKLVNKAELDPKIQLCAVKMANQINDTKLTSGKSPAGIAAAFVYISSVMLGEKIPQREIAEYADVTEVTIRNRTREILDRYTIRQIIKTK